MNLGGCGTDGRPGMIPALFAFAFLALSCSAPAGGAGSSGTDTSREDDRLVVLGPSLVEMMYELGLGHLVVGVDRYSKWPPEVNELVDVGGYLDPSMEVIHGLEPTSIHSVGFNPDLQAFAVEAGLPGGYRSYSFDTLEDILASAESLRSFYPEAAGAESFRAVLEATLDSLGRAIAGAGMDGTSVLLVIWHERDSGSLTVAGRGTFLHGLVEGIGLELSAPGACGYPMLSLESVLALSPDWILYLSPDVSDPEGVLDRERRFWSGCGFDTSRVCLLSDDYLLVPGPRIVLTAGRVADCVLSGTDRQGS